MATITGITSAKPMSRFGGRLGDVNVSVITIRFEHYRINDGPVVSEQLFVQRSQPASGGPPWPEVVFRLKELLPSGRVVQLTANLEDNRWVWSDIAGPVDDVAFDAIFAGLESEADAKAAAMASASPAVHQSDEITLRSGERVLVPDAYRQEPVELEGIGTMWPQYSDDFAHVAYHSDPMPIAAMNGLAVRFEMGVNDDEGQQLREQAFRNLLAAGPELRAAATPYVLQHYQSVRNQFSDEECAEYDIALDIDEHPTTAAAYDDPSRLGEIF